MALFSDEKLLSLLMQYNPWWIGGTIPSAYNPPQRRYAFYEVKKLLERKELRRFAVLSGARRVGKTTDLYQRAYRAGGQIDSEGTS